MIAFALLVQKAPLKTSTGIEYGPNSMRKAMEHGLAYQLPMHYRAAFLHRSFVVLCSIQ
ncbi:MAG TPA: hypothetical protein VGY98_08340 [Verrucomicrobiae bacterium]|nr:hypothetical protein [Verrucomicrobiae bacterium]